MRITVEVNGASRELEVEPLARLLDVLRDDLGLTGTKEGCGEGECGACTVLLDGRPVVSCLLPACHADGHRLVTIEGVTVDGMTVDGVADLVELSAVQESLVAHGAVQCGMCTPGIVLAATAAIESEPQASRQRVRELLAGNLCRCTGYQLLVDAVVDAARAGDRAR